MGIEIRQTAPDDPVALGLAEALRDEVEAREAHNGAARPDTPLAVAVRADSDTLVAYTDSKPVALGALRAFGPGVAEVDEDVRAAGIPGSGVGSQILDELERRARERGFDAVRLDTNTRLSQAIGSMRGGIPADPGLQLEPAIEPLVRKSSSEFP